jgi:hypothetical protein
VGEEGCRVPAPGRRSRARRGPAHRRAPAAGHRQGCRQEEAAWGVLARRVCYTQAQGRRQQVLRKLAEQAYRRE